MIRIKAIALYALLQSCILSGMNTLSIDVPQINGIHCLAFIDNTTLLVGAGIGCLTIKNIGIGKYQITTFDEHAPCNFVINHDRTLLAIQKKRDLTLYNLNTRIKLSQTEITYPYCAAAMNRDNTLFACCNNDLYNITSSESFKLIHKTNSSHITCHPHEQIISYIQSNDTIANINYQGELVSTYQPELTTTGTNEFYSQKDHITSIFYSPDGSALVCNTQENHTIVYDITEKKTMFRCKKQYIGFFNASIFVLLGHHGSIFFEDYKTMQNITQTGALTSSLTHLYPSKKKFDFSPNKLFFALCIDGACYIKHTPIAILKDFFIVRYLFIKQYSENYKLPIEIARLIIFKSALPHLHHPTT